MLRDLILSKRLWPLLVSQTAAVITDNLYRQTILFMTLYVLAPVIHTGNWKHFISSNLPMVLLVAPYLVFSSLAGDMCDKHSKSKMIVALKAIEFFIALFGAYALYMQNIYLMLAVLLALGARATFLSPLRLAIMPEYLTEKELILGNAVFEPAIFGGIFLGEVLANVLFIGSGYGLWIVISILVSLSAISLVASFYLPETPAINPKLKINYNIFKGMFDIVQSTRHHRTVYLCILGISWFWLVASMVLVEIPHVLEKTINTTPGVITLSMIIFSLGISAGSVLCNRLLQTRIEATYVPLAAFGISFLLYDLASILHTLKPHELALNIRSFLGYWNHLRLIIDFFLIGALGGLYHVPLYTIMQHESPKDQRARIMACHNIVSTSFTIAGAALNFALSYFYNGNPAYTLAFISLMFVWISLYISQIMPYDILTTALRWAFKFFYRARIEGLEHLKKASDDKLIIVCNHTTWLDTIILAAFLPEKLTFVFNNTMTAHWLVKHFIKLNKVFMIDPTQPLSIRRLIDAVKEGEKIVIFPEGRITATGSLMKIYEFPAVIAETTGAKILPVHIHGMEKSFFSLSPYKKLFSLHGHMAICIHEARFFPKPKQGDKREKRKIASDFLYKLMTEMNFENNRSHENLFTSLLSASRMHGRHRKLFEDINRSPISYHQLIMRCFIMRSMLTKTLSYNSYVGVLLPTALPSVINFYALQCMGKVPVMLNYTHGPSQLLSCCQTSSIKDIITAHKLVDYLNLSSHIETLERAGYRILYIDDMVKTLTWYDKLIGAVAAWIPFSYYRWLGTSRCEHDTALLLFTSGSEGNPKGVVLSHANIQANVSQILSTTDLHSNDIIFNALPLYHSFGMMGALVLPLFTGMRVFFYPTPLHYRIISELVYDLNATVIFSTDYFLSLYAKHANAYDFYSLRYVVAGGEKLQDSTSKLWADKFGIRILGGYGLTEASPVVSANNPMHNQHGSVGRLMPKLEAKLEPMEDIKEGGKLWIKGPNIMQGYMLHEKPGILQPPKDGWHDTGDICRFDENGFLFILDRAKRFAKIAGEMVSLTTVEALISTNFPDHPHAVIAKPCPKRGEEIILCTEESSLTRSKVQQTFQKQGISELWIPKVIVHTDIPRFATGKANYIELKKKLTDN